MDYPTIVHAVLTVLLPALALAAYRRYLKVRRLLVESNLAAYAYRWNACSLLARPASERDKSLDDSVRQFVRTHTSADPDTIVRRAGGPSPTVKES